MTLRLRENIHWCNSGGRVVFLDLEADRYFCLPAAANAAFLRLAADEATPDDFTKLDGLLRQRLLVENPESQPFQQPPIVEIATANFERQNSLSRHIHPVLTTLAAEARTSWRLATLPFKEAIGANTLRVAKRPLASPDEHRLLDEIVRGANACAIIMRSHNRCLVRALSVYSLCRKHCITTKLVFGVAMHPFAAHCWVQVGNKVLVGDFEQARLHTPILVLE